MEDKKEINITSTPTEDLTINQKANKYFNNLSKEMKVIIIFVAIASVAALLIANTVKLWNIFF